MYTVTLRNEEICPSSNANSDDVIESTTSTSLTIGNLQELTEYSITVASINSRSSATSQPSLPLLATTLRGGNNANTLHIGAVIVEKAGVAMASPLFFMMLHDEKGSSLPSACGVLILLGHENNKIKIFF